MQPSQPLLSADIAFAQPLIVVPVSVAGAQSWPRKFEQADKWSFCLKAAMIAANRREHEQTTAPEP
jgi:hypothetical protein